MAAAAVLLVASSAQLAGTDAVVLQGVRNKGQYTNTTRLTAGDDVHRKLPQADLNNDASTGSTRAVRLVSASVAGAAAAGAALLLARAAGTGPMFMQE